MQSKQDKAIAIARKQKNEKGLNSIKQQNAMFTESKKRGVGYTDDNNGNYFLIKKGGWDDLQGDISKNRKSILRKIGMSENAIGKYVPDKITQFDEVGHHPVHHIHLKMLEKTEPKLAKMIIAKGFGNKRI